MHSAGPPEQSVDLRRYLGMLWRRRWLFLGVVLAIPAAAYLWTASLDKVYESNVLLQVQTATVDTSLFEGDSSGYVAPEALGAAARLVQTSGVAREAARQLGESPVSVGELRGSIRAAPDEATGFISITATSSNPRRARDIADAYASALSATRAKQSRLRVDRAVEQVTRDLGTVPRDDVDGRRQLSQQLQRLRALRAAQGQNSEVIEPAGLPSAPISPHPARNAILGLILGALLGLGLVMVAEHLDRRIRHPEDLEDLTGTPLLATIPLAAFPNLDPSPQVALAFQGLRDTLSYFNVNLPIETIAVTSPLKGDGKTTVATNLAVALARAGKKVILVDADLRNPQVAKRMGVEAKVGLSNLLSQGSRPDDALVEVPMFGAGLRVLASGPVPPNPSELVGSSRMRTLLERLNGLTDYVVIDTTPLLAVSDALPLLDQVSGTIVVAKLGYTSRDAVSRLMQVAGTGHADLLGTVATGARPGSLYSYGAYGYGYGVTPQLEAETSDALASGASSGDGNGAQSKLRRFVSRPEKSGDGDATIKSLARGVRAKWPSSKDGMGHE